MSAIYFPIRIESTSQTIRLNDSAKLIRIDKPRLRDSLGLTDVKFDDGGNLQHLRVRAGSVWGLWMAHFRDIDPNISLTARACSHVLITDTVESARLVGLYLKLLRGTSSGPYVGFSEPKAGDSPDTFHIAYCPYWGGEAMPLGRGELRSMRQLLGTTSNFSVHEKLGVMLSKFCYAESREPPSLAMRYFEFSVILEMLFLPKHEAELAYRFQLRFAKWFERHDHADVSAAASQAKKIYGFRSKIAHAGTAKELTLDDLNIVRGACRTAVRSFLMQPKFFQNDYLDQLCLGCAPHR